MKFEWALYGVLILGCAWGVRTVFADPQPEQRAPLVAKSTADGDRLKGYVKWTKGTPMIVEFMDFECPPCRQSWPKVKELLKKHPEIQYRVVHFPLQMHANAFPAAVAAEVAREHGDFDRVFDDLFSGKTSLSKADLNAYLKSRKLPPIVGTDEARRYEDRVVQDMTFAEGLQVRATPTLLLLAKDGSLSQVNSLDAVAEAL